MKHYALVGRGGGNKRVISASLNDLPQDSHFHVLWTGEDPTPGQEVVYDWLIDNEKVFTVYGENVPRGIARYAEDVSDDPMYTAARNAGCDTALILWEEGMDDLIISTSGIFPKMLELTNGLTPIEVADDEEPVAEPTPVKPEEEGFFTREELENMPAAAVKRQAKERGLDITGKVKSQIIDMLLSGEAEEPEEIVTETAHILEPVDSGLSEIINALKEIDKSIREHQDKAADLLKQRRDLVTKIAKALDYDAAIL